MKVCVNQKRTFRISVAVLTCASQHHLKCFWRETGYFVHDDVCISNPREKLSQIMVDMIGNLFLTSEIKMCVHF
jgi:hypothetical protein